MSAEKGLFRGTEFSRLLVLAAIMVVGWTLFAIYANWSGNPPEAPPLAAQVKPLPPADESPVFAGIQDKTPQSARDDEAVSELLRRTRTTPNLVGLSRRDVLPYDLLRRPFRYRGLPIHIDATAFEVFVQDEIDPKIAPRGRYYEAWIFHPENPRYPCCLVFEQAPASLPAGHDLREKISFDGYFLKLLAYSAKDGSRFAPMLIGRLSHYPTVIAPRSPVWTFLPLALLAGYFLVRWVFQMRRLLTPQPLLTTSLPHSDEIAPDRLQEWLNRPPVEDQETSPPDGSSERS